MEDSAIVDLYWQRSEQAISETDRKYDDTWFSAWNSMPDKRPSVLSTFLGYITRNFAIDRFKLNQMIISKNPQFTGISARQQLEFTTHLLLTD